MWRLNHVQMTRMNLPALPDPYFNILIFKTRVLGCENLLTFRH